MSHGPNGDLENLVRIVSLQQTCWIAAKKPEAIGKCSKKSSKRCEILSFKVGMLCPVPGGAQGQAGWALGSLGWYEMWRLVALPVGGVGASRFLGSLPAQPFCASDSVIKPFFYEWLSPMSHLLQTNEGR